jgi:hypothetical protein
MPIDIKWVRNHAAQVQEWQRQRQRQEHRRRSNDNDDTTTTTTNTTRGGELERVTRVAQLDDDCRHQLHRIREIRERINILSKQLRGSSSQVEEVEEQQHEQRASLLQERSDLQVSLTRHEDTYRHQQTVLTKLLWSLASPIDEAMVDLYPLYQTQSLPQHGNEQLHRNHHRHHHNDRSIQQPPQQHYDMDLTRNMGWRFAQAVTCASLNYLGSKCGHLHPCPPVDTATASSSQQQQQQQHDLFQAMWGGMSTSTTNDLDDPTPAASSSAEPTGVGMDVPSWIPFLATAMPKKSIFGAKQLPQYTLLQGTPSTGRAARSTSNDGMGGDLQLLALTAGTTWDARQVQQQVAHELQSLYESFLVGVDSSTTTAGMHQGIQLQRLPISDLARHEHSRIVVTFQGHVLGWVSNFGDAAARACELIFKGGGRHDTKEHVYVVHASIVTPTTIQHILQGNSIQNPDGVVVKVPPTLRQCGLGGVESIPLAALGCSSSTTTKKKKDPLFGAASLVDKPLEPTRRHNNQRLFPLLEPHSSFGKKLQSAEARACPFGFLI